MTKKKIKLNRVNHVKNILDSFEKLTGKEIIKRSSPERDYKNIKSGHFVLVSHNGLEDPILNYGNSFALKLWEMDWNSFIQTPSRNTAEKDKQGKRQEILEIVNKQGYLEAYEGIRISSTGKRFLIKEALIWTVFNKEKKKICQAAFFDKIEYLSL